MLTKKYQILNERLYRLYKVLERIEKEPKDYNVGYLLFGSEAHMIEHICETPDSNVTEIASAMGITKSAVSQIISKLEKRKLIEKFIKSGNKKEVYLKLTDEGKKVYEGHKKFHEANSYSCLSDESPFSENDTETVIKFLNHLTEDLIVRFLKKDRNHGLGTK